MRASRVVFGALAECRFFRPVRDILPKNRHDSEHLRVLEQKVNASDPPSPRLRRAKQTERSGQVRSATVYHALLRITHHVQHPVQKQGRPVPNQRSRTA
jgi:hypothetical protein